MLLKETLVDVAILRLESVTGERRGDFRDRTRSVQAATSVAKKFYDGSEGFTLTSQLRKLA